MTGIARFKTFSVYALHILLGRIEESDGNPVMICAKNMRKNGGYNEIYKNAWLR